MPGIAEEVRRKHKEVFELEAVPPTLMQQVVTDAIEGTIDRDAFNLELGNERNDASTLQAMKHVVADAFSDIAAMDIGNDG